jgi:hypothetical protein
MSSNIKPKPAAKESPTEPFKRAVASCMRALSRKPDLEITYAAERPGMAGGKARLPEPPRKLSAQDAAIVRGHADSIALKLACHDPAVHRRQMPSGQQGRAVFEAVEQARVEAIGARRMQGVAQNLGAMLDDKFHRGKFDDVTDRADAPIEDAVALMVRERLTGQQPPPAARKLVDLWRPFIEERAGKELDRLERLVENQRRFGDVIHDLLDSLEMGDERARDSEEDDQDDSGQDDKQQNQGEDGDSKESEDAQGMSMEEMEVSAEELPDGASEAMDAPSADMPDDADMGDSEAANEPWRPRQHGHNEPRGPDYKPYCGEVRRDHRGRGPVRAGGARPAQRLSRQAALAPAGRGVAARQPAAAPADGAAEPRLGVRSRGRPARPGTAAAHHHRSAARAVVQAREGHDLPRHGRHAAARQFRLDARPPDHRRGDLRGHPGAHAGALRREGGDPRLHDARLEGRAVARGLARGRQAAQPRAGSTTCATSSTSRPTRRGGARARISA